jgi:hypothetical protein
MGKRQSLDVCCVCLESSPLTWATDSTKGTHTKQHRKKYRVKREKVGHSKVFRNVQCSVRRLTLLTIRSNTTTTSNSNSKRQEHIHTKTLLIHTVHTQRDSKSSNLHLLASFGKLFENSMCERSTHTYSSRYYIYIYIRSVRTYVYVPQPSNMNHQHQQLYEPLQSS